MAHETHGAAANHAPRIIASWILVAIPLIYGLEETLQAVAKLFN